MGFLQTETLRLHYLEWPGGSPPLLLLHGLTANAHSFDRLAAALSPARRCLAPDLRGRGQSDVPPAGYTMEDHAGDLLALLDQLDCGPVVPVGHSYGGFLALYLAAHHPERVDRLVLLDIAVRLRPEVGTLLAPVVARLGRDYDSWESYRAAAQDAPHYQGQWDQEMERYHRADVRPTPKGGVTPRTPPEAIAACSAGVAEIAWPDLATRVPHPTLLVHAAAPYGPPGTAPLITRSEARETVALLPDGRYEPAAGNHITMLFGARGDQVAATILEFLDD